MENSTTYNPIIEYRLDTYGDDLDEVVDGLEELKNTVKLAVMAGNDCGLLEQLSARVTDLVIKRDACIDTPELPTRFREYGARLLFEGSPDVNGITGQNFLVRTSTLEEELERFPLNRHLLAIKETDGPPLCQHS